jgi:membrane-associated phospholipid phosphatase
MLSRVRPRKASRARSPRRPEQFLAHPRPTLAAAAGLLAFVAILAVVLPADPLTLDRRWSELMLDTQTAALTHLALVFNALGHGLWRALTLAAVAVALLITRRWAALVAFALTETLTPLLVNLIKSLAQRPRPPAHMLTPHGSSFPSGHTAYAGATAVAIVLLFSKPERRRALWYIFAALGIAGMAWSRTYLQDHWLTDALAGAALGIALTLASFAAVQIRLASAGQQDMG